MDWSTRSWFARVVGMTNAPRAATSRALLTDVAEVRATLVGTGAAPAFERLVVRLWELELAAAGQTPERGSSTAGGIGDPR